MWNPGSDLYYPDLPRMVTDTSGSSSLQQPVSLLVALLTDMDQGLLQEEEGGAEISPLFLAIASLKLNYVSMAMGELFISNLWMHYVP